MVKLVINLHPHPFLLFLLVKTRLNYVYIVIVKLSQLTTPGARLRSVYMYVRMHKNWLCNLGLSEKKRKKEKKTFFLSEASMTGQYSSFRSPQLTITLHACLPFFPNSFRRLFFVSSSLLSLTALMRRWLLLPF